MAYHYEGERHRHDPYSRSGLRPHEFPSRGETGTGGLAVAVVLIVLFGIVVLISAFSGAGTVTPSDTAIPAEGTAPAGTVTTPVD